MLPSVPPQGAAPEAAPQEIVQTRIDSALAARLRAAAAGEAAAETGVAEGPSGLGPGALAPLPVLTVGGALAAALGWVLLVGRRRARGPRRRSPGGVGVSSRAGSHEASELSVAAWGATARQTPPQAPLALPPDVAAALARMAARRRAPVEGTDPRGRPPEGEGRRPPPAAGGLDIWVGG